MNEGISNEAVMFFDNHMIVKEMLYPEFEAILDQVVGISEFKGQTVRAAYVRINAYLNITAAVFFLIDFNDSGNADKGWNIPLRHMADNSVGGPDLGSGPIKLSCRSQCSVSWHQRSLWDPKMEAENNTFQLLTTVSKSNRLGFAVVEKVSKKSSSSKTVAGVKGSKGSSSKNHLSKSERKEIEKKITEELKGKFLKEIKEQSASLLEEQKLRIATMKSDALDHVEKLQQQYQQKLSSVTENLEATKKLFSEEKQRNLLLKKTLDNKAQDFQKAREDLQQQIKQGKEVGQSQLTKLEKKFEQEVKAKIDISCAELKENLNMREMELFYRDEEVIRLRDEIKQLREDKQSLVDSSGDQLLKKLDKSGISFVASQPGMNQLTVPYVELSTYLESPAQYAANKCSVDLELYQKWKAHYELSVCGHKLSNGSACAEPIPTVEHPVRFILGEGDRCTKHNLSAKVLSHIMKIRKAN